MMGDCISELLLYIFLGDDKHTFKYIYGTEYKLFCHERALLSKAFKKAKKVKFVSENDTGVNGIKITSTKKGKQTFKATIT